MPILSTLAAGNSVISNKLQLNNLLGGWEIIMHSNQTKANISNFAPFGDPGTSTFKTITESSTGAASRNSFGDGLGLYKAFFNKKNITKFALVSGDGNLQDPTSNTRYCIYEADYTNGRETTGEETIYEILRRIGDALEADNYLGVANHFNTNSDALVRANSPGFTEIVGDSNGYSALFVEGSSSTFGGTSVSGHADTFCLWGENFDSDHDTQVLCFYEGRLQSSNGKGDAWRNNTPAQTVWSYWGDDFFSEGSEAGINVRKQTNVGANTHTGDIYLLAF